MLKIGRRGRWRSLALIHRLEYPLPLQYLCYAAWGACYAVEGTGQLLEPPVLLTITANFLLALVLNALNAAVDVDTDGRSSHKRELADAVLTIGRTRTLWLGWAEMFLALALSTVASLQTGRWLIAAVVLLIIALHVLYNFEPVRLKRRAFANPVTFGLSMGFLQGITSYLATRPDVSVSAWTILASLGVLVTARAWWWSVPDHSDDSATGMATPAVRYGAARTLVVSCLLTLTGLFLLGAGLWWRYGWGWALLGVLVNLPFFATQLVLLLRIRDRALPTSTDLRWHSLPLSVLANVVVVVIPLAAS